MANLWALVELDSAWIRGLVVERGFRQAKIVDAFELEREVGEDLEATFDTLQRHLGDEEHQLVLAVGADFLRTRMLQFPFDDARKVLAAVDFEIEGQSALEPDEVVSCKQVLERGEGRSSVAVALAPKEHISTLLAAASVCDLEPRHVVPRFLGIPELVETKRPLLWLDVSENDTQLAYIEDGSLRYVRGFRAGAADVDRSIAESFDISAHEARKRRLAAADWSNLDGATQVKLATASQAGVAHLARNALSTIHSESFPSRTPRLVLTGQLAEIPGLNQALAERLGIQTADISIDAASREHAPELDALPLRFAGLLGLALHFIKKGLAHEFDLRRGEFAYRGDLDSLRGQALGVGVGMTVLALLAFVAAVLNSALVRSHERALDKQFCQATKKTVGREICNPVQALAVMRQPGGGIGVVVPQRSTPSMFEAVSSAVKSDVDVVLDRFTATMPNSVDEAAAIELSGNSATFDAAEALRSGLKAAPCLHSVELLKQQKSSRNEGRIDFSLKAEYLCDTGAVALGTGGQ